MPDLEDLAANLMDDIDPRLLELIERGRASTTWW